MSTRTRRDWILLGALGCALVGTAHAEYTLAVTAHFHPWVALAVPGALDLYVLRALQQRRDVLVAVLAMVAANVTSHLLAAGVLHDHWLITSAAGALAPLILWRVYALKAGAGTTSAPVLAPSTEAGTQPAHQSWCGLTHPDDGPCSEYGAPDTVPEWMQSEYPPSTVPGLYSLPELPDEYTPSTVTAALVELKPSDHPYLDGAQEYLDFVGEDASLRGLMKHLAIGQERAARLLAHLEAGETT